MPNNLCRGAAEDSIIELTSIRAIRGHSFPFAFKIPLMLIEEDSYEIIGGHGRLCSILTRMEKYERELRELASQAG